MAASTEYTQVHHGCVNNCFEFGNKQYWSMDSGYDQTFKLW